MLQGEQVLSILVRLEPPIECTALDPLRELRRDRRAVVARYELDEIRFGRWERTRFGDGYESWARSASPEETCPGGGESRVEAARRYASGFRVLLERPEARLALVAHGAQIRYLLLAVSGSPPARILEHVPPAEPYRVDLDELGRAIELLEAWAAAPEFAPEPMAIPASAPD